MLNTSIRAELDPSNRLIVLAKGEISDLDSISQLPEEILLKIFGFLRATEQARCGEVSRKWKKLTSDENLKAAFNPRTLSPSIKVFDGSDWNLYVDMSAYGLTTGDLPPGDARKKTALLERILSSPLMGEIEEDAGITLLTIPKGLTFNKLVALAQSPKMGNKVDFRSILDNISIQLGDVSVDKTYQIVLTNNIFKNSRNLDVSDQTELASKKGCQVPKLVEATALIALTYVSCGVRLYNDTPGTFTICSEISGIWSSVIGGFSPLGISVDVNPFDAPHKFYGVGGVLSLNRGSDL